jgi:predicted dehydrogenase
VCTTRKESAEESAKRFEARLAFHDYREMLAYPNIDAVAVVLRMPSHYQTTLDAINAGKHVFTEWPLGKTLAEAQDLAEQARRKQVQHIAGLQARANPTIMYISYFLNLR